MLQMIFVSITERNNTPLFASLLTVNGSGTTQREITLEEAYEWLQWLGQKRTMQHIIWSDKTYTSHQYFITVNG